MNVVDQIGRLGLVPVVEIPDAALAGPLGQALLAGGLPCAEITFRTSSAAAAIAVLRRECPDLLVGAGTVLTPAQVDAAADAGAAFIVAPGFNPATLERARARGLPMIPGVCTPTEIEQALSHGVDVLKFFPAEAAGGVAFLRAVSAPYKNVRFIPTGGVSASNLASYLALPQVLACGGSWMVSQGLLLRGDFEAIRRLTSEAVSVAAAARIQASARQ
jgi:2-dehydro-3-deoxyphosphogluconate aldolase/(4S)-4-hydroxy-2-oxoglutarate aldolase